METSFFGSLWRTIKVACLCVVSFICIVLLVICFTVFEMGIPALFRGVVNSDGVATLMVATGFTMGSLVTLWFAVPVLLRLTKESGDEGFRVPVLLLKALTWVVGVLVIQQILVRWPWFADAIPVWVAESRHDRMFYVAILVTTLLLMCWHLDKLRKSKRTAAS